jgi:hypothetical protein
VTAEVAAALTMPVVSAAGLAAGLLVLVAGPSVGVLVTIAHEGGHMVVGVLTGHKILYFELDDGDNAGTQPATTRWGPGRILTAFAGYVTPPLVGLGGAALLTAGKAWPLLLTAVVLLVLAWVKARGELTTFVVLLLAALHRVRRALRTAGAAGRLRGRTGVADAIRRPAIGRGLLHQRPFRRRETRPRHADPTLRVEGRIRGGCGRLSVEGR